MNIQDLLPIGSVILLKGAKKRIMIYGVKQTDAATQIDYDYIGVVYPEGSMGKGSQLLFNHDQIEEVSFRGLEDEERDAFIAKLAEYYQVKGQN